MAVLFGIFTWFWVIQALYGPFKVVISKHLLIRQKRRFEAASIGASQKRVVLIVAAKGVNEFFDRFLELVTWQNYGDYRIILVTESKTDPARMATARFLGLKGDESVWQSSSNKGLKEVELVVAGLSQDEGQKVHNQRAAFERLTPEDEIIAFADADIVGSTEWLEEMVRPLNAGAAELTTGYRWFIPERNTLANIVATNINRGIALLAGPSWHTLLWGGSMALKRETFDELDVPGMLEGSLNDDLQISRAALKSGKQLLFVRTLMAPSPVDYTWSSFFEFARRQYFQVRTYVPGYWWAGFGITLGWLLGAAVTWGNLLTGNLQALFPIGLVVGSVIARTLMEQSYVKLFLPDETVEQLKFSNRVGLITNTLNFAVHFGIIVSTAWMKGITWAGIQYRVSGPQETQVVGR